MLGVSMRAPNGGIYGELGWLPFYTRATKQATSFFTRVTDMPDSCFVRKAMYVQRSLLSQGHTCWLSIFKDSLCNTACGRGFWDTWWNSHNFRCTCERQAELDSQGRPVGPSVRVEEDVYDAIQYVAIQEWQADVMRVHAKRGEGSNKLRTYQLFKHEWGFEPYLKYLNNRGKRVLLSKFRIGIAPLRIETGRYENDGNHKGVPANQRKCLVCESVNCIEDEIHFLLKCPKYDNVRSKMFSSIRSIPKCNIDLNNLDLPVLFSDIMSSRDKDVIHSVANFLWDSFRIREKVLLNTNHANHVN